MPGAPHTRLDAGAILEGEDPPPNLTTTERNGALDPLHCSHQANFQTKSGRKQQGPLPLSHEMAFCAFDFPGLLRQKPINRDL